MPIMRIEERYRRGYEFQEYVKDLLGLSGYLEGQIHSTGIPRGIDYARQLERTGRAAYTSPDILILNKWAEDSPEVEFRFGLSCGRRDRIWDEFGQKSFTLPTYQRYSLEKIRRDKHLPIYLVFGSQDRGELHMGVIPLREPDSKRRLTDESTGHERTVDVHYLSKMMSWYEFLLERTKAGDKEPDLETIHRYKIEWVGDLK